MKKLIMIVTLLFSLFFLEGCDFISSYGDNELKDLRTKYQAFIKTDVSDPQIFQDLMNEITFEEQSSVFKLMKVERNILPLETTVTYGNAVLFSQDLHRFYLFTLTELIEEQSRWTNLYLYDIYGNEFNVAVEFVSEEHHLAVISVLRNFKAYHHAKIAVDMPFSGELVIGLGSTDLIANTQKLGIYTTDGDQHLMSSSSTSFAKGRAVFNLQRKLIGLQYEQVDNQAILLDQTIIRAFLDKYQSQ